MIGSDLFKSFIILHACDGIPLFSLSKESSRLLRAQGIMLELRLALGVMPDDGTALDLRTQKGHDTLNCKCVLRSKVNNDGPIRRISEIDLRKFHRYLDFRENYNSKKPKALGASLRI